MISFATLILYVSAPLAVVVALQLILGVGKIRRLNSKLQPEAAKKQRGIWVGWLILAIICFYCLLIAMTLESRGRDTPLRLLPTLVQLDSRDLTATPHP